MTTTAITTTPVAAAPSSPLAELRKQFTAMQPELAMALPAHVAPERFVRIVMTAIQQTPDLMKADRKSLFAACMKAAQDGLLPDGREAFLNCYYSKKDNKFVASYQPMIAGVLKKIRQSGELKQLSCDVVREGDVFEHYVDETGEHFKHQSSDEDNASAPVKYVYAALWTKDGGFYFKKMTPKAVEKARAVSRAANSGPWVQWWDEMALKTVLRNLSKRVPMSVEVESVIHRVDDLYDIEIGNEIGNETAQSPINRGSEALKARMLARQQREKINESLLIAGAMPGEPPPEMDVETGELLDIEVPEAG
jgi:recombination protein RecT